MPLPRSLLGSLSMSYTALDPYHSVIDEAGIRGIRINLARALTLTVTLTVTLTLTVTVTVTLTLSWSTI